MRIQRTLDQGHDRLSPPASVTRRSSQRGPFLLIGVLLVAALIGVYVLAGTPGLHTQVAKVPNTQSLLPQRQL